MQRQAVLIKMHAPGAYVQPLILSLMSLISKKYMKCGCLNVNSSITDNYNFILSQINDQSSETGCLNFDPELTLNKIHSLGMRLNDTIVKGRITDLFVTGGFPALKTAAGLALFFREKNMPIRCIFIPACPFNSVPFVEYCPSFGSAVKWCSELGRSLLLSRKSVARSVPVSVIEIEGDNSGWLTAGTAAMAGSGAQIICIPAGIEFNVNNFIKSLSGKLKKGLQVLIVTSDKIRDENLKIIAKKNAGNVLAKIIEKKLKVKSCVFNINPGDFFDKTHFSRQDLIESRAMARAAVNLALKTAKKNTSFLVTNRTASNIENKKQFDVFPLFEAINTRRKLPDKLLNVKQYKTMPALSQQLKRFIK